MWRHGHLSHLRIFFASDLRNSNVTSARRRFTGNSPWKCLFEWHFNGIKIEEEVNTQSLYGKFSLLHKIIFFSYIRNYLAWFLELFCSSLSSFHQGQCIFICLRVLLVNNPVQSKQIEDEVTGFISVYFTCETIYHLTPEK